MNIKKTLAIAAMICFVIVFYLYNSSSSQGTTPHKFHTPEQLDAYRGIPTRAPIAPGEYFLPSTSCRGCHGYDSAHMANITEAGDDVNLVDRWESSMMAMSAKDPLWRAKVSMEITINPGHSAALQDKCTSCHSPMGRYTSHFQGHGNYGLSNLLAGDPLGLDGVACGSCHMIGPNVGFSYSGNIPYDTMGHVEYGPFPAPYVGPMQLYEGFTPTYSNHMDKGKVCSTCHTLQTETVDLAGNFTGGVFTEQATYHEYVNSSFPGNNITCQTCHMPKVNEPILIANGVTGLTPRSPFNQHKFAGANYFMLNLIKNNRDSLGVDVGPEKFDSTIATVSNMLRTQTLNIDLTIDSSTADTAFFGVKLENKAGHKFPSGYPGRRAVVQFVVTDALNDTVFRSGMFDPNYRVVGENPAPGFEPHHNIINQSNVPQIYEIVMGDVNGNFTSVLERAATAIKDNRIPPVGFTSSSPVYDTVFNTTDAENDPDFNKVSSVEGSGIDHLHFHVPLAGASGLLTVKAKVYYQSVPPKWVDEMFAMNTYLINRFKAMYQSADHTPFLVGADSLVNIGTTTSIAQMEQKSIRVWPTLTMDGIVKVSADYGQLIQSVTLLNTEGKTLKQFVNSGFGAEIEVQIPPAPGVYYLKIMTGGKIITRKVVKT